MQIHSLSSSMCDGACVDGADLLVRFTPSNKWYRYEGAAHELQALLAAESAGRYVNGMLKPNYSASQCDAPADA